MSKKRLDRAVSGILKSYQQHPDIERISKTPLPSKEAIVELIQDIQVLLFPGFLRQEILQPLDVPYLVGQRSVSLFHRLQTYMKQVLIWEQSLASKPNTIKENKLDQKVESLALEFLELIPTLRQQLMEDIQAIYEGDPAAHSPQEIVLGYPGLQAISIHRVAHFFYQQQIPLLPRIMAEYVHAQTGIDIHPGAQLGSSIMIDHGTGIVIGETAVIGNCVRLYQGVTIGALSPTHKPQTATKRHPTIEDNVVIYAGATILGGKTVVGAHSIIGGNAWLTHSVPPNSLVVRDNQERKVTQKSVKEMMLCPEIKK